MARASFQSNLYRIAIRIAGIKHVIEKEFQANDFTKNSKPAAIPGSVLRQCNVVQRQSDAGRPVWELRIKNTLPRRHIFYLHGGAFVHNITTYDWKLLSKIANATGYGIIIPDYPLAPQYTYKDVFAMIVPLYEELIRCVGHDNLTIMGFSAGGGLALSLAQYLRTHLKLQPSKIILLSPLLDASLKNPEIVHVVNVDPYLNVAGLRKALDAYAGADGLDHYMISPINGDLNALAPIYLFAGTDELLMPDARRLVTLAKKANVSIEYHEYYRMYHAWVFLTMPEAHDAIRRVIQILKG